VVTDQFLWATSHRFSVLNSPPADVHYKRAARGGRVDQLYVGTANRQAVLLLAGFLMAGASVILALFVGKPAGSAASSSGGGSRLLAFMNRKNYLITVAVIFLIIALAHLVRILLGWDMSIRGWTVPSLASPRAYEIASKEFSYHFGKGRSQLLIKVTVEDS
jgi:hypothetical protein